MGAVADRLELTVEECRNHLRVDDDTDDALIGALLEAGKQRADSYLNNPFVVLKPQITVVGVVVGDGIVISDTTDGSTTFTAALATDLEEHEFDATGTDDQTAAALVLCINDSVYGLRNTVATAVNNVITLTWRLKRALPIAVSSATDSLDAVERLSNEDIPEPVKVWVMERVAKGYEKRVEGVRRESPGGLGSVDWGEQNFDLLEAYRYVPGL